MEDETLSECKSQNQKLMEFITKKENLTQLIHYITKTPENPDDKNSSYRFPFICSDLLTSSIKIAEALVPIKPVEKEDTSDVEDSHNETTAVSTSAV